MAHSVQERIPEAFPSEVGHETLGALVRAALSVSPDQVALRYAGAEKTCGAVLADADRVAERLAALGIGAGEPVVLEMEHSFEMVAALCGILLAGGAAVPVDPKLPVERRRAIFSDVDPRLYIELSEDGLSPEIKTRSSHIGAHPGLAFIVYTSGSSGGPKGVEITHDAYVGRLKHIISSNPTAPEDVDLIWTPSSFIGMLDEVFFPFLKHIPAVIASPAARSDPRAFADLVAREKITTFRITPSLLDVFLTPVTAEKLQGLRAIYASGETMSDAVQKKVHDLIPATIIGFYGATEAPGIAYHVYDRDADPLTSTVCTPQDFTRLRFVDATGADVPTGQTGEIWIGGLAVAQGYWRKPELTDETFVQAQGVSWYRTGDLGRRLEDGRFEVLGRANLNEVNILGVRVNIPEVREVLCGLDGVTETWVSIVEMSPGEDPVLVGHCVTQDIAGFDPDALRTTLAARLPTAAVPRLLLGRESFPLTANGKLDAMALKQEAHDLLTTHPAPADANAGDVPLSDQANVLLPLVLEVAEETLKTSGVTARDNFFVLGGNSLLAVQFALLISERLDLELTSTLIFNTANFGEVAETIASGRSEKVSPLRLLRAGAEGAPPLFTINAIGAYVRLSRQLQAQGTVYNLNLFGLTNEVVDRIDRLTLQDIAQRFADAVLEAHPTGPWRLMAFCQDGCLAVEIGRILQARNQGSCSLLLIDTFFLDHKFNFRMLISRAIDMGPSYFFQKFRNRFLGKPPDQKPKEISVEQRAAQLEKSQNDGRLYRRYMEFFMSYQPTSFEGPIVLFVSTEWRHVRLDGIREMARNGLVVKDLPGRHGAIFSPQTLPVLANAVDGSLEDLSAQGH
ncbi:AMP-binding protein [uncultured Roseobacter sp.]|uniref:non-ribosomal peptide synthetase n=1 Tax=uncultured Roseobacter sp. TaxID=114847 RepID=UPI002603504E|nr:AMP-binding protein [uncultured Roseobacter sp.]